MKTKSWLIIILCIIFIIVFLSITVFGDWYGFGVDSAGCVYIGSHSQIDVYANNILIDSIEVPPNRTFYFTVQNDDTILLSTSLDIFVIDLHGNILSCEPDDRNITYNKLQWKREVETKSGERFYCRNFLGWRTIESDSGEVVYQTPFANYWVRIICCIVVIALIAIAVIRTWKQCTKK